jgi:DNA-binding MarR family transcriptional regulator
MIGSAGASGPNSAQAGTAASLEPGDSPGFLLWRVALRWQRLMMATLRPLGLTHVQFVLLASLWWLTEQAAEKPTQRRLSEFAATDPMMTSQVLRALEAKGLVERATHPTDSRARQLGVTGSGSKLAREAIRAVEGADRSFFAAAAGERPLLHFLRALTDTT